MKRRIRYKNLDQVSFEDILIYSKLPEHPFWSNIEQKIDFSFADPLCAVLYSTRGQHPYSPSLKLKVHLVQAYYNVSDRSTEEKIIGDLFIKRFLGVSASFFGFDHSTIALDRSRMGEAMFRACHLYILAQMKQLGLWGEQGEQWIIDSFSANVAISKVSAHRLIMKAMIQILQHLKRNHPALYEFTTKSVALDSLSTRLAKDSSENERMLAFSKTVAQALGLLQWFQNDDMVVKMEQWSNEQAKQKCIKFTSLLERVLMENTRDLLANDDNVNGGDSSSPLVIDNQVDPRYVKIPFKERSTNRIFNLTDPDVTVSKKNGTKTTGYKIQNLITSSEVVLSVKAVPAIEHDRTAMYGMVKEIQEFFRSTPNAILADTVYGHGQQRLQLAVLNIPIIAPVQQSENPKGFFNNDRFTYNSEKDVYICPNNRNSVRKNRNTKINGTQYHFGKQCTDCPLKSECTDSVTGRSIFQSDFHDIYEKAIVFNESIEGKAIYSIRLIVERKNQELKNDCGLGQLQTRSKEQVNIKATLAGIVTNLKLTVRRLINPKPGFIRQPKLC